VLRVALRADLAKLFGWKRVLGLACIPLSIVLVGLSVPRQGFAEPARAEADRRISRPLKTGRRMVVHALLQRQLWWIRRLSASLSLYFTDTFGLTTINAGYLTAACVFAGSLIRPFRRRAGRSCGGNQDLSVVYVVAAVALAAVSTGPSTVPAALALFVVAMLAFGAGNGAGVPARPAALSCRDRRDDRSRGMAGGIGGFYLSSSLGFAKQLTGNYGPGFLIFAGIAVVALVGLTIGEARMEDHLGRSHSGRTHLVMPSAAPSLCTAQKCTCSLKLIGSP
jgi:NNP family nitrate/nitrite transporter-like MFS transporter